MRRMSTHLHFSIGIGLLIGLFANRLHLTTIGACVVSTALVLTLWPVADAVENLRPRRRRRGSRGAR